MPGEKPLTVITKIRKNNSCAHRLDALVMEVLVRCERKSGGGNESTFINQEQSCRDGDDKAQLIYKPGIRSNMSPCSVAD